MLRRFLLAFALFAAPLLAIGAAGTKVRLLLDHTQARPGETVLAGVEMQMPAGWHTYWRNPSENGGIGTRTLIDWTLPPGLSAGEIQWPVPEKHSSLAGDTHVHTGTILLLVPLTVAPGTPPGALQGTAKVTWQECQEECVPGGASISVSLVVGPESKPSPDNARFDNARQALPKPGTHLTAHVFWEGPPTADQRPIVIEWTTDALTADFFAYERKGTDIGVKTETVSATNGIIRLRKWVDPTAGGWPTNLTGLLVANPGSPQRLGYEVILPIGAAPALAAVPTEPFSWGTLVPMLGLAFLGGLILNIMPCVLPVLALKILGFVRQAGSNPARVRQLGLVYAAGVVASFLVLAAVALAVQAAGGVAGWSTAFQNPQFRVVMCALLVLVSLNLFGVFEVNLGGGALGAADELTAREGPAGAFFNGVLAAVLATPCTAPFLATAIGFAFTQPPLVVLAIFLMVGLGLAAPFVLLCWQPAWLKLLPKPGVWMERFKVAMGFPMLGTAIWIFWFTAARLGPSGVLWLGLFLVVLAAAAWVWGEFGQRGGRTRLAMGIAGSLLALGYIGLLEGELEWRTPAAQRKPKVDWQVWSPAAVAQARKSGQPVLVDFTADNCANCKFNKATSIEIASTIAKMREGRVATFAGDFTDADPAIAAELQKYGRRGVPLVLVYPRDPSKPPRALPTVLTPSILHEALDWATQ